MVMPLKVNVKLELNSDKTDLCFNVDMSRVILRNTTVVGVGRNRNAGAIKSKDSSVEIYDSYFGHCFAKRGGALYLISDRGKHT